MRALAAAIMLAISPAGSAVAHPGGLNAEGCHRNRKTGEYHCHRASASETPRPQTAPPRSDADRPRIHDGADQPSFRSCAEARAAGYRGMRTGEPGYSRNLDRDRDGVACE
jgi:hypothetical protein